MYMRILLVEDEIKLAKAIKAGLEQQSYAVDIVHDADSGLAYAETEDYDLIILDRRLPEGKDGLDICKKLREANSSTPIIMLTARGDVDDRIDGLKSGADDYLVKPFSMPELYARLQVLLRRPPELLASKTKLGDLEIDLTHQQIVRGKDRIKLSKKEYALLEYLLRNRGQTVSKDKLIQHVWDFDADILPNTVEAFMRNLRKKLDNPNKPSIITTVRGFGYMIEDS